MIKDEVDGAVDEDGHVEDVTQRHVDVVEDAVVDAAEEGEDALRQLVHGAQGCRDQGIDVKTKTPRLKAETKASTPCGSSAATKHSTTATSIAVVRAFSPSRSDSSRRPADLSRRRLAAARRIAATSKPLSTASRMHGTTLKKTPNSQKLMAVTDSGKKAVDSNQ